MGSSLSKACSDRGGRLSLIRRPGRHADDAHVPDHAAYLAWAGTDPWLLRLTVTDPAALLDLDLDALARGDREAVLAAAPGAEPAEPILLVCTNGRRDVCCAVRGRPVALDAADDHPGRVWEASHTGGHRFAPTGVLLPHGATLARLDAELCGEVLETAADGRLPAALLGPAARPRPQRPDRTGAGRRVARAARGRHHRPRRPDQHSHRGQRACMPCGTATGGSWRVALERREHGDLPESCGKVPVHVVDWAGRTLDLRIGTSPTRHAPGICQLPNRYRYDCIFRIAAAMSKRLHEDGSPQRRGMSASALREKMEAGVWPFECTSNAPSR